jgi:uncharacterized protein (DUF302 family)
MKRTWMTVCVAGLTVAAAASHADLVTRQSAHPVAETVNRLETAVKEKGATVVARVNHAAAAQKAEMNLRPTELLIFGNPKLGTPLMQSNQRAGIDLPLKVLVWEDAGKKVWLGYEAPGAIAERHGIQDRAEVVKKMTAVLDELTAKAAQK